jgi:hypothetical protein
MQHQIVVLLPVVVVEPVQLVQTQLIVVLVPGVQVCLCLLPAAVLSMLAAVAEEDIKVPQRPVVRVAAVLAEDQLVLLVEPEQQISEQGAEVQVTAQDLAVLADLAL